MIDKVKVLLGISTEDTSKDGIIKFCIDSVEDKILDYCNIDTIPTRLENTVIAMCVDWYRSANYGNESLAGEEKSIQAGDTTIQYVTTADITVSAANFIDKYKSQLNRFRVVKFP